MYQSSKMFQVQASMAKEYNWINSVSINYQQFQIPEPLTGVLLREDLMMSPSTLKMFRVLENMIWLIA